MEGGLATGHLLGNLSPCIAETLHSSAPKNSAWLTIFIQMRAANTPPIAPYPLRRLAIKAPYSVRNSPAATQTKAHNTDAGHTSRERIGTGGRNLNRSANVSTSTRNELTAPTDQPTALLNSDAPPSR